MELCNRGHDEVCFDSGRCPVCEVIGELDEARLDIASRERDIAALEAEIRGIRSELNSMERL